MRRLRRSGRIASEVPIVLLGMDTTGKVFSEETKTVVLSRHGAGIVSRYALAPDELLTLRLPGSTEQAEVRLVGNIGGQPGSYIYGVTFVDPDPHFWPVEFPPPEPVEGAGQRLALECSLCRTRQNVEQHEIEEDVYSVNGNVLRYCARCGASTPWTKALGEPAPLPDASPAQNYSDSPTLLVEQSFEPTFSRPTSSGARAAFHPPVFADLGASASATPDSPWSAASALAGLDASSVQQGPPALARATAVLQPPALVTAPPAMESASALQVAPAGASTKDVPARMLDANGRRVNRRRDMRVRVNFSACLRDAAQGDEIVECENVSKGGLCFRSPRQYSLDSWIEVAAPYSPGELALFVPAQIKRVEALSDGKVSRYGAAYAKRNSARPSF